MMAEMSGIADFDILQRARALFLASGRVSAREAEEIFQDLEYQKIQADGSSRRFWRLRYGKQSFGLIIAPGGSDQTELAESRSVWKIGTHLHQKGIPVPEIYGWDRETGVLLCEDLGDVRLHDCLNVPKENSGKSCESVDQYYHDTLKQLAKMQIHGADGLQQDWCWDNPRYDVDVMVERESGYFLRTFWQGVMGREVAEGVSAEFNHLAALAADAPGTFFLHRDFQSRNIMIKKGKVRFIDFQAGRFGPLGYDVASLLIDPYAALSMQKQEELLQYYVDYVKTICSIDAQQFKEHFSLLALHRNLQIVGAFSYLSKVKGKRFFAAYIIPALITLNDRLGESLYTDYVLVRKMLKEAVRDLKLV